MGRIRAMSEFTCIVCNALVYYYGENNPPQRCMVCQWIHNQPELTQDQIDEIRIMTATPILDKEDVGNE
jgi:hypothetical protein